MSFIPDEYVEKEFMNLAEEDPEQYKNVINKEEKSFKLVDET